MTEHIRKFLLELGVGFAFVGSQYHLEVGGEDFYLDLLFYHLRLRCFIVIDLKIGKFQPEYAGKMNFYLSAIDDLLRHQDDQPSIGIILCKAKNKVIAEYALRDTRKPIGVSGYRLTETLPKELKGNLPTIEELEASLSASIAVSVKLTNEESAEKRDIEDDRKSLDKNNQEVITLRSQFVISNPEKLWRQSFQ